MIYITVFTPTYNRAYIISNLYESLKNQTCKDFEWLIVDDGSTDETETLVKDFIDISDFPIRYIKQENGGKHRAINHGVKEANGELFFIVDSDDTLTSDSIEKVLYYYNPIKDDSTYCGVCGFRKVKDDSDIINHSSEDYFDGNLINIRSQLKKRNIIYKNGDTAPVIKTKILEKYPFPNITGEYFCAESLIWNRITNIYRVRFFSHLIYNCRYLEDGLSHSSITLRMNNPTYTMMVYKEILSYNISLIDKIKGAINYWRFYFCNKERINSDISLYWYVFLPIGWAMHIRDLRHVNNIKIR